MEQQPIIISSYDGGKRNADLDQAVSQLEASAQYKDLSTIIIIPAFKSVPTKVVASWLNLIMPPNQRIARLFAIGMEVGDAYSRTIESVLAHPEISTWKYMLTLEHDNMPPPDGLMKLLARMESDEGRDYAAIGGLYFTKGEGGVPQIWGDPQSFPLNFRPQRPDPNGGIKECCGTGMGFTLFRLSMFKDEKLRRPWFRTTASTTEGINSQDLFFWTDARKNGGYRAAIDCGCKVGHYSVEQDFVW